MDKKSRRSAKADKKAGLRIPGKKIDNSLEIAPGQKHFALVLSKKTMAGKEHKLPSKKQVVMYLPETIIKVVSRTGRIRYRIEAIYNEIAISKNGLKTFDLDQLMLGSRNQVRMLRHEHPEAGAWYKEAIKKLSGTGHMALTAPSTIAKDGELRQMVQPNELVMYDLETLSREEDDNIIFYQICIYYLRRNALVKYAVELDKLILSAKQLKDLRKKDWEAARWYASKKGLQSGSAYVKDELGFEATEEEPID